MIVSDRSLVFRSYQHWFENGVEFKKCWACREPKTLSEYNKDKTAKDSLHWRCRVCESRIWKEGYDRRKLTQK